MSAEPTLTRQRAGRRAQRMGRSWESVVEDLLRLLELRGLCTWWRTPEPLQRIRHIGGGRWECAPLSVGPPDYVVLASGRAIALEAKETEADRWPLSALAEHQAKALDAWRRQGGCGVVALRLAGAAWALDWERLGPRWWAWRQGRAARGEASLAHADCLALGAELDVEGRWL